MSWVSGIVVFLIIWWLILFMVLPFGVVTQDEAEDPVEPGTVGSAPARHNLARKMGITTAIAAVLWLIFWAVVTLGGLTLEDVAGPLPFP